MRQDIIDRLQRFLEGAPLTTKSAVAGWTVDGLTVCGTCAGRILDRGCSLGDKVIPIWDGPVKCELKH